MPAIFVWAVVTDERGVLLVPARGADGWLLPGGPLRSEDETVEEAMLRELEARFGVRLSEEPLFLDTQYERRPDGETVVHNLFHVPSELLGPSVGTRQDGVHWLDPATTNDSALPGWLRQGLATLFNGDAAAPSFDLDQIQAAMGEYRRAQPVVIVTGPAGAGKSTVARELCRRFPRAAHIDVDLLRWRMVVSGYVRPEEAYGPEPEEALRQFLLAARNACALAGNFTSEGFLAVIDDVLETRDQLDAYLAYLQGSGPMYVVTVLPNAQVLAARDAGRPGDEYMGSRSEELRRIIAENGETRGLRLDTSAWTVEETVDIILERLDQARVATVWEDGS